LYQSLIGSTGDGDDMLEIMLVSHGLQQCLVDSYIQMRHFSLAMVVALNYRTMKIDPVAFVEDTYQIQYQLTLFSSAPIIGVAEQCLEEALRMGGLIYMKDLLREYPMAALGTTNLVHRLKDALTDILNVEEFAPILLWLCFVAGVSSKRGPDRTWFTAQLMKLGMKLGLGTWDEARNVMKSVMFVDSFHEEPCRGLWEEMDVMKTVFSETIYG
jgi:hypothetical protein